MGVVFYFVMLLMCLLNDYLSICKGERLLLSVKDQFRPVQTAIPQSTEARRLDQTLGFSLTLQFSSIRSAALDDPDTAVIYTSFSCRTSLLAEALFLVFVDGRKETSAMGRKWLY